MNITKDQLAGEVGVARTNGWLPVFAQAEQRHNLPAGLLLAIASRETNMSDIVGDGGHGRGLFQIDDRSHGDFLSQQGAAGVGGKPPVPAAADYAAGLLASNLAFGKGKRVAANQLLKFACSAYNAGAGNAWSGFQAGDSDRRTAGGDYGRDVLDRLAAIQASNGGGPAPIFQRGSKGPQVTRLKTDLQAWYDRNAPGVFARFAVAPGPNFGTAVVKCVSDFQQRNGLAVTGTVDQALLTLLAGKPATPPPGPPQPMPPQPGGILERGDRGAAVKRLKVALQSWYDRASPGEWQSFGVAGGPVFGAALERAVREFQQRNGLFVDGQVGPDTQSVLDAAAPAPGKRPQPNLPDLRFAAMKRGSTGQRVKLLQAWLSLHGFKVAVGVGPFGPATDAQLRAFQKSKGLPVTGVVDSGTWAALVQPIVSALLPLAGGRPLGQLVVAYARQHLAQHPLEVGGENAGPWVRLYTDGREGATFPWCAAFATFCLEQACDTLGVAMPVPRTLACDEMARNAGDRMLAQPTPSQRSRITPGSFFLRLAGPGAGFKYDHTGIVVSAEADKFSTIEGNTNDEGSAEGFEVCARVRGYPGMDFIVV